MALCRLKSTTTTATATKQNNSGDCRRCCWPARLPGNCQLLILLLCLTKESHRERERERARECKLSLVCLCCREYQVLFFGVQENNGAGSYSPFSSQLLPHRWWIQHFAADVTANWLNWTELNQSVNWPRWLNCPQKRRSKVAVVVAVVVVGPTKFSPLFVWFCLLDGDGEIKLTGVELVAGWLAGWLPGLAPITFYNF